MKASHLIELLEEIVERQGDLDVCLPNGRPLRIVEVIKDSSSTLVAHDDAYARRRQRGTRPLSAAVNMPAPITNEDLVRSLRGREDARKRWDALER